MLIHIFTECWRWEYEEEIISSLRFCFFSLFQACRFACSYHSYMHAFKPTFFACCFTSPSQHTLSSLLHHIFFLHRAYSPDNYNPIFFFASSFVWSDVFLCTRTWCSAKYRIRKRHAIAIFGNDFGKNFAFCFEF